MTILRYASTPLHCMPLLLAVFLALTPLASGQVDLPGFGSKIPQNGNNLVEVSAAFDGSAVIPGEESLVGVRYQIHPGWHIYWKNAGDEGAPTELAIRGPKGIQIGAVQWPRPKVLRSQGDSSFGYSKETMLFVPFTVPKSFEGDTVSITITTAWLVCKKSCLFGQREWTIEVPVARDGEVITRRSDQEDSNFSKFMKILPKPISRRRGVRAQVIAGKNGLHEMLRIEGPASEGMPVIFIPDHTPGVRYKGNIPFESRVVAGSFLIEVPLEVVPGDALGKPLRAAGLIGLGNGQMMESLSFSIAIGQDLDSNKKSLDD